MEVLDYLLGKKSSGGGGDEPTGTINISSNGTKNVKSYAYANVNVQPKLETKSVTITSNGTTTVTPTSGKDGMSSVQITTDISDRDWTEIGYTAEPSSIQDGFDYAKQIYNNWDASITNRNSQFVNDKNLEFFPEVSMSNTTNAQNMFSKCHSLRTVGSNILNNPNSNMNASNMFYHCDSLEEVGDVDFTGDKSSMFAACFNLKKVKSIHFTGDQESNSSVFTSCDFLEEIGTIKTSITSNVYKVFDQCLNLSNDTLKKILKDYCAKLVDQPSNKKTLTAIGLSYAQATLCKTFDEWQDLANAGWS